MSYKLNEADELKCQVWALQDMLLYLFIYLPREPSVAWIAKSICHYSLESAATSIDNAPYDQDEKSQAMSWSSFFMKRNLFARDDIAKWEETRRANGLWYKEPPGSELEPEPDEDEEDNDEPT